MNFNIAITRKRRFFQRKSAQEKYLQELEAFQKEWYALYEHGERVKQMQEELQNKK